MSCIRFCDYFPQTNLSYVITITAMLMQYASRIIVTMIADGNGDETRS